MRTAYNQTGVVNSSFCELRAKGRREGRPELETSAVKDSSSHMGDTGAGLAFWEEESEKESGGA